MFKDKTGAWHDPMGLCHAIREAYLAAEHEGMEDVEKATLQGKKGEDHYLFVMEGKTEGDWQILVIEIKQFVDGYRVVGKLGLS